jgi:hypothetical protein
MECAGSIWGEVGISIFGDGRIYRFMGGQNRTNHELAYICFMRYFSELFPIHVVSYKTGTFLIGS